MSRSLPYDCLYYSQGACLYSEVLNPGRDEALRCVRLVQLMEEWDDFLDRAEAFNLSEEVASRIWNSRHHAALDLRKVCPVTAPVHIRQGLDSEELDCLHLFQGACRLAMPRCMGQCDRFVSRRGKMR